MNKFNAFFLFILFSFKFSTALHAIDFEEELAETRVLKALPKLIPSAPHTFNDFMEIARPGAYALISADFAKGGFYSCLGPFTHSTFTNACLGGGKSEDFPSQGWKLHVSVPYAHIPELVNCVVPLLFSKRVDHKIVTSTDAYNVLLTSETQAGKFITIYPKSDAHAVEIAKILDEAILGLHLSPSLFPVPPYEAIIGHSAAISTRYGKLQSSSLISKGKNLYVVDKEGNLLKDKVTLDKRNGEGWPDVYYPPAPFCTSNPFLEAKLKITKPGEKFIEETLSLPQKSKYRGVEASKWVWQFPTAYVHDLDEYVLSSFLNSQFDMDEKTALPKGWKLVDSSKNRDINKPVTLKKKVSGVEVLGDDYTFYTNMPTLNNYNQTTFLFIVELRGTKPGTYIQYWDGVKSVSSAPYNGNGKGDWDTLRVEFTVDAPNARFHRLYAAILGTKKGTDNPSVDIRSIKLEPKPL